MKERSQASHQMALRDFQYARKQAVMQQILSRLRGQEGELLCFDEVRQQLRSTGEPVRLGLQEIPLDKIVGSVARYHEFTRSFLPKHDSDEQRWAEVRAAVTDMVGMPPIDVYQIGDTYFVKDGNHRVSIARQLNTKTISAYVTEIKTRVPLTADDDPNEIICKARYADFLERTNLDKLRPEANLLMTFCEQYPSLFEQIEAELNLLKENQWEGDDESLWAKAVTDWYDFVYMPVIRIVRDLGVLHYFPERTEADMYVLLSERETELENELGWQVEMETGVSELIAMKEQPDNFLTRVITSISPFLDRGPLPGLWRKQQLARQRYHHLFEYILVPLDDSDEGWSMFEYVLRMAQLDGDHILGLHVVPDKSQLASEKVHRMRTRFNQGCQQAEIRGEFAVDVGGSPVRSIVRHAAWVDVVIVNSACPPEDGPLPRISQDLKLIIQRCPRPIMVRPDGTQSTYNHGLLAYDGSSKADEALFIATYLTARWAKKLTVVTVETANTSEAALEKARHYLTRHGLSQVKYVLKKGPIAESVLETADERTVDLLFMGGFSFRPVRHLTLGSTAERILREFRFPMWVCR